jgi:hypothetical protein
MMRLCVKNCKILANFLRNFVSTSLIELVCLNFGLFLNILPCYTGGQEPEPRQNFFLEPELEPRKNNAALHEKLRNFGKLLTKFRINLTDRAGMTASQ